MDTEMERERELIVAATGDSMITRRLSVYTEERYLSMVEILRSADIAFTNLEGMIHNYEGYPYKPYPYGTPMTAPPYTAEELKWMGFNLVATANNHSMDYSEESMLAMFRALDSAGVVHSGMGWDLAEARLPAFVETKKGRVALISAAITSWGGRRGAGTPHTMASYAAPGVRGRPGVNGLRFDTTYVVDRGSLEELKKIRSLLKIEAPKFFGKDTPLREKIEEDEELIFIDQRFKVGDKADVYMTANKNDIEANLREIRGAKKQADWVLMSFHAHASDVDPDVSAPFVRKFEQDCINAGADAVIAHGHHQGRGIEIYKGKPIFHSLGTFIMQTETNARIPADSYEKYGLDPMSATVGDWSDARLRLWKGYLGPWYFKTVIAVFTLIGGKLAEMKLYPVDARHGAPRSERGRPMLADEKVGKEIIERYKRLSAPFGTEIEFKEGIGVVKV